MRSHETHHDDCGCLSARYEARIAELEQRERDSDKMHAVQVARVEILIGEVATLEASLGECVTKAAGMIGTDAEMAAGPNHGVVLAALDWLRGQKATLEAELASSREDAKLAWAEAAMGPTEAAITHELAQSQAHANALRDALVSLHGACEYPDSCHKYPNHRCRSCRDNFVIDAALAQTPAASLAAHDAEVLERVAKHFAQMAAERPGQIGQAFYEAADREVRALAAQEVKP